MSKFKALLTDYAWPDLDVEQEVLSKSGVELVVSPSGDHDQLLKLAGDVDAILTNWAKTTADIIGASGKCQIVARLGIGLDNIDVEYCTSQKIPVTNIPDYCVIEVAEHALAMLLAMARDIAFFHLETKQGKYNLQAGPTMRRIEGQTLGILGLGNIGQRLARKAICLGMNVIATVHHPQTKMAGVENVSFEDLLKRSDYISIHAPLTKQTRHIFGCRQFELMKSSAYLINTARGGLIDHAALWQALQENQIAGAALDVHDPEPADLSQPLYQDPRVIVCPHAAFVSEESLADLRRRAAIQVVTRLQGGIPENVRNPQVLAK